MPLRHLFSISVNNNNHLLIEDELHDTSELSDMLYHYYTDNITGNNNDLSAAGYKEFNK